MDFQKARRVPPFTVLKNLRFLSLRYSADIKRSGLVYSVSDQQQGGFGVDASGHLSAHVGHHGRPFRQHFHPVRHDDLSSTVPRASPQFRHITKR